MTDAFSENGSGEFVGIELTEQEVRLRPKTTIACKATDLHGKIFMGIKPDKAGAVMFGVLVDGRPAKAFMHEYVAGANFEDKDLGVVRAYAFDYPAWARTAGEHEIILYRGKQVLSEIPGVLYTQILEETEPYTVNITEGEEA